MTQNKILLPPGELYKVAERYLARGGLQPGGAVSLYGEIVPVLDLIYWSAHRGIISLPTKTYTTTGQKTHYTLANDELWHVTRYHLWKSSGTGTFDFLGSVEQTFSGPASPQKWDVFASSGDKVGALDLWLGPTSSIEVDVDAVTTSLDCILSLAVEVWKTLGVR